MRTLELEANATALATFRAHGTYKRLHRPIRDYRLIPGGTQFGNGLVVIKTA
jgi:hypothetical protein